MIKVGIGIPGKSIADIQASGEVAAQYNFDSFSVYGDLGDLPPYAVLHASAHLFRDSPIKYVGPMGVPVGLQHDEVTASHAIALAEQLPKNSSVGLVRGAFLDQIGEKPASLAKLEESVDYISRRMADSGLEVPVFIGGFGSRLLSDAGRIGVAGVKLGGSANPDLAQRAKEIIANPEVSVILGAVSVIDKDRAAARERARREVAKYINVVGLLDPTLDEEDHSSLEAFLKRYPSDPEAHRSISSSLLDKFSMAGTPDDVIPRLVAINGFADRFEFGTPHGLGDRPSAIKFIGDAILRETEHESYKSKTEHDKESGLVISGVVHFDGKQAQASITSIAADKEDVISFPSTYQHAQT